MSAERKLGGNGDLATYEPVEALQRPWFEWVCPDCPDWACGGVDEGGVAEGKRLHVRTTHDGLTFREAIREYWDAQPKAEAPKQAGASEVADDGAVLPCGCVPPCEGHHEDVS